MKRLTAMLLFASCQLTAETHVTDSWQDIPQEQLAYLQLQQGVVVIELADRFTPKTTARFRQLVGQRFYDGLTFYRVIDQFVLQAGLPEGETHPVGAMKTSWGPLAAEFSWPVRKSDLYVPVQTGDLLAEETGFNQGFAVGRGNGREWLLHCPNVINMARGSNANSATTDFAIMQGQAPRHLDKNMGVFGRVIWGQQWLNAVPRGGLETGGVIEKTAQRGRILSIRLGSELPAAEQFQLQQQRADSAEFAALMQRRRERPDEFYQDKGNGKLDICYQGLPVRLKGRQ